MSELLRQMDLLSFLAQRKAASAAELAAELGVSEITVKRDVAMVRHYGADIISDRQHGYRLMNWDRIKGTVRKWRELERKRDDLHERGLS